MKYRLIVSGQERNVQYHKYTMTKAVSTLNSGPDGPVLHQLHVMLESFPTSMARHSLLLNIYSINVFLESKASCCRQVGPNIVDNIRMEKRSEKEGRKHLQTHCGSENKSILQLWR